MTRNNNSKTRHTSSNSTRADTSSNDDTFINLPDLSSLKDDEKQHILNVLLRDENLRNKHLARFMYVHMNYRNNKTLLLFRQLKKDVADLEKKSQSTSPSVCARCQTPFGFLFNTGDICPKCSAKVCKQCQLMYNVNDNGWVCQLCCKQM
jgi:synaptotagmin-like protein